MNRVEKKIVREHFDLVRIRRKKILHPGARFLLGDTVRLVKYNKKFWKIGEIPDNCEHVVVVVVVGGGDGGTWLGGMVCRW